MNRTVWKFGARWSEEGSPKSLIVDNVFRRYNIVFADTHGVLDMRPGDLVALANGHTVIAIAEALSNPKEISQLGIVPSEEDKKEFFDAENVCGCVVRYFWLSESEQFQYKKAGRFFQASQIKNKVNVLFDTKSKI